MNLVFDRWLTDHSAAVQALSAVVGVLLTGALVWTTVRYLQTTMGILEESRKAREATEKQASAAQRSVDFLQLQLNEQRGLARSVVQSAIDTAIAAIALWKRRPFTDVSKARGFPDPDNLVPTNANIAVEHADRYHGRPRIPLFGVRRSSECGP